MFNSVKNLLLNDATKLPSLIDLHSHFLPDIDDGCESVEDSLKLITQMKKLGYKKLITTPHIMSKKYPNTIQSIKKSLFEIRGMLKVKNIDIELEASAEYYFDNHFIDLVLNKELLYFGDNYILFELPYTTRPLLLEEMIVKMVSLGYKPVLAHPERYRFLREVTEYRKLKSLGLFFQVNINSLEGYYGHEVQKKAIMLSQKGMVDFIGSDIHHQKHMDSYKESIFSENTKMLFKKNKILNDYI